MLNKSSIIVLWHCESVVRCCHTLVSHAVTLTLKFGVTTWLCLGYVEATLRFAKWTSQVTTAEMALSNALIQHNRSGSGPGPTPKVRSSKQLDLDPSAART